MAHRIGVCGSCRSRFQIPAQFAHKKARCRSCGGVVEIGPLEGEAEPVPAARAVDTPPPNPTPAPREVRPAQRPEPVAPEPATLPAAPRVRPQAPARRPGALVGVLVVVAIVAIVAIGLRSWFGSEEPEAGASAAPASGLEPQGTTSPR